MAKTKNHGQEIMVIAIEASALAYAPVPKSGCSSVKAMLMEIDPAAALHVGQEAGQKLYHALYPTRRFRKKRMEKLRGFFRFTVVRDPIRRLMSVYTNRVVELRELHNSRKLRNRGILPLDPDPDTFFQNLDRYMHHSWAIKHHALPAHFFTGPDLGVYDQVFRTDQMDAVAQAISDYTHRPVGAKRANASSAKLAFDDLAPATRDSLRPYLMREYTHLAAHFDNPVS